MSKMQKCEKTWNYDIVEHKGFKDLGNYVIQMDDYTDISMQERGLANFNEMADHGELPVFGCTAMAKRNSKGEVIIGRNMDLDISQTPAYVFKTTYGKYDNYGVVYGPGFYLPYEEVKKLDEIDPKVVDSLTVMTCDCLNEKGLYIESNLREENEKLYCYGLHSAHGEKTRDDGTPWSELRACTICAPQLVAQNCATIKEAVAYLKNSYDWYTVSPNPGAELAVANNNMCFLVGDATGEYGLIEFAQDEVNYIPYQYGQANYYITPKWNSIDTHGAGVGRLQMVSKVIEGPDTLEEAMDAMKPIMWRNETLWVGESERKKKGECKHPYNQLIFRDDEDTPQMDWRGEYVYQWPVLDDGRMLISEKLYDEAIKSTYDPKIKEYYDDAIATGYLVIDDGSFMFDVDGEQLNLTQLAEKYEEYRSGKCKSLKPYFNEYWRIITNLDNSWAHDDFHFEAMKAAAYASLHVRYNDDGEFDPNAMSKYEKLLVFYGYGCEKDERPLRDDGGIWTTSLNVGVNCAQKEMKVRFWENDDIIYHIKF